MSALNRCIFRKNPVGCHHIKSNIGRFSWDTRYKIFKFGFWEIWVGHSIIWSNWLNRFTNYPGSFVQLLFHWWLGSVWALGQGATEVRCGLGLDLPGLIHTWLPTCTCIWTLGQPWYSELNWSNLNLNGASRVGFGVSGLAVGWLRCLHWECWCALGSVHASPESDRQLVYASCPLGCWWAGICFGVPCHFWCRWCGLSAVGLGAPELTWKVSSVVVSD